MFKKTMLILLCCTTAGIKTSPTDAAQDLTPKQKSIVRFGVLISAINIGVVAGGIAVSYLPEKTSFAVKAAVFTPIALIFGGICNTEKQVNMMIDFHKKHKLLFGWL